MNFFSASHRIPLLPTSFHHKNDNTFTVFFLWVSSEPFQSQSINASKPLLNEKEWNKGAFKPNERIKLCVCFPTLWFLQGGFFCSIYGLWLGMRIEMQISKENGWISLLAFFSFGLRKVTSKKCNLKRILRGVQRRLRRLVLIKDDRYWQSFVSFKWHLITFEKTFQFKRQSSGLLLTF